MTEEQKTRLEQRLRELKERLDGKPAPTVKDSALLTELQPGYMEVLGCGDSARKSDSCFYARKYR